MGKRGRYGLGMGELGYWRPLRLRGFQIQLIGIR